MADLDLEMSLVTLGWRGSDLARRLGVDGETVSRWKRGKVPVPGYAKEYLRVVLLAKESVG